MALLLDNRPNANLPAGLQDIEPPAPAILRELSARLALAFAENGYQEFVPPLLERYDTYPQEECREILSKALKLVGPSGEVLAVRHDLTASVLSQLRRMAGPAAPARISYISSVIRTLPAPAARLTEYLQAGVECCVEGAAADREVFILSLDAMAAVGLAGVTVHVGHVGVLDRLLRAAGVSETAISKAHEALINQSLPSFFTALAEGGADPSAIAFLRRWVAPAAAGEEGLSAFVSAATGAGFAGSRLPKGLATFLGDVTTLFKEATATNPTVRVVWNPLLVGSQPYYNGLVFQAFVPDLPSAVALGGRYDSLVRAFGVGQGGVGFTIQLSEVIKLMGKIHATSAAARGSGPVVVAALDGYQRQAVVLAGVLRSEGRSVTKVVPVKDVAEAEREARRAGAALLIVVDRRGYVELPQPARKQSQPGGGVVGVVAGIH